VTDQVSDIRLTSLSHGAGCACKLPLAKLDQLMATLGPGPAGGLAGAAGDLLVGAAEGDDAAVLKLDDDRALVLTTDFFTPIVDDARDWGRVAATNALSDVYAMGGRPLIALNLTAWPGQTLPIELLAEVLRGGSEAAAAGGCLVVGGHTIDDPEPKYGLAVVGMADPGRLMTVDRARDGDLLVLTKPIGTGVIATAHKRGAAPDDVLAAAVAAMTTLNGPASEAALRAGVRAATDVTGFGLLGHLHRMLRASGVAAEVWADQVPLLPGAAGLAAAGFVSGGTSANMSYLSGVADIEPDTDADTAVLLHDAQTSGGLLIAVPPGQVDALRADLREHGTEAALVGAVETGEPGRIAVRATTGGESAGRAAR
jgi:selenide, water dikinase